MSDSEARDDEVPERTEATPLPEDDLTASLGRTDRRVLLRGALGHFALLVASGRAASATPGASPLDCGEYTRGTPSVLVLDTDGTVLHSELVPEIAQEPDYDAAIASLG